MTARSDDPGVSPGTSAAAGGEIWGTWEELLLACAVRKHGTASWDSVAMELLSRCPPAAAESLTPAGCRLRYRLLHRRFAAGAGSENGDGDEEPDAASADGCVEELRKLRVAELRREVVAIQGGTAQGGEREEHLRRGQSTTGGEGGGRRRGGGGGAGSGEGIAGGGGRCRRRGGSCLRRRVRAVVQGVQLVRSEAAAAGARRRRHRRHRGRRRGGEGGGRRGAGRRPRVVGREARAGLRRVGGRVQGQRAGRRGEGEQRRAELGQPVPPPRAGDRRRRRRGGGGGLSAAATATARRGAPCGGGRGPARVPRVGADQQAGLRVRAPAREPGRREIQEHYQAPRGPGDGEVEAGRWGRELRLGDRVLPRPAPAVRQRAGVLPARLARALGRGADARARRQAHVQGPAGGALGEGGRGAGGVQEGQGGGRRRVAAGEDGTHHRVPEAELHRQGRGGGHRQGGEAGDGRQGGGGAAEGGGGQEEGGGRQRQGQGCAGPEDEQDPRRACCPEGCGCSEPEEGGGGRGQRLGQRRAARGGQEAACC